MSVYSMLEYIRGIMTEVIHSMAFDE